MAWTVYGEELFTANFGAGIPTFWQKITIPSKNYVLAAVRAWLIFYNSPSFATIEMRLYANDNGVPCDLIATSQSLQNNILTEPHALLELPFIFSPKPMLHGSDVYHLAIQIDSYTGNANSHIAWKRDWPDPENPTGFTPTFENLLTAPFSYALFGGKP